MSAELFTKYEGAANVHNPSISVQRLRMGRLGESVTFPGKSTRKPWFSSDLLRLLRGEDRGRFPWEKVENGVSGLWECSNRILGELSYSSDTEKRTPNSLWFTGLRLSAFTVCKLIEK